MTGISLEERSEHKGSQTTQAVYDDDICSLHEPKLKKTFASIYKLNKLIILICTNKSTFKITSKFPSMRH